MKYGKLTLKQHRQLAGLTQQELAEALGVDRATLSMWETGKYPKAFEQVAIMENLYGIHWADDVLLSET